MSFSDPLQITYNAVTKDLNKVNQDGYSSVFYFDDASNDKRFHASVKHTLPKSDGTGESHMLRLDIEHFDTNDVLVRKDSAWVAVRTDSGFQNTTELDYLVDSLVALLTTANIDKLLTRQS